MYIYIYMYVYIYMCVYVCIKFLMQSTIIIIILKLVHKESQAISDTNHPLSFHNKGFFFFFYIIQFFFLLSTEVACV